MVKRNGFTLIEVLICLGILSILFVLSVPLSVTSIEKHKEKQFLTTLEFDILYVQGLAATTNETVEIRFREDHYVIYKGSMGEITKIENFPKDWDINMDVMKSITFYRNGNIKKPGKIQITTDRSTYELVFPFGKGRGYIEEK